MATSGSTDFNMTGKEIVQAAVSIVSDRSSEIPLVTNEVTDGLKVLNRMIKAWQGQPLHLWKRDEAILFLNVGQSEYTVGGSNSTQACLASDFVQTLLAADAIATATTITVDSTVGMQGLVDSSVADKIGIKLDDGTRQWTTIDEVVDATTLNLTDALTDDATDGVSIFTYTTDIEKPLRIESVRRARVGNNTEVELDQWARQEYFAQTNKSSQGTPTAFFYSPRLDDGQVYVWQTASSVDQLAKFTFARSFQDFDTSANNPDFPVEWLDALIFNLAARLALEYQTPLPKVQLIKQDAIESLEAILGWDEEDTSINLQPDLR